MTAPSESFLAAANARMLARPPEQLASAVRALVERTDSWRQHECLNMNAAENTTSASTRRLLDSDLATRVTEGFPGDKEFPPQVQNNAIDEIEATLIHLARRLFGAEFVEWRPVSTTMAFMATMLATTERGDTLLVQSMEGGGSMTYSSDGPPGWMGLNVVEIPPGPLFEIDLDATRDLARKHLPRLIIVGGSYILFEPALAELHEIAQSCGALLVYDAAHVSLYGATGCSPSPLAVGVDIVVTSTHKILGGPVGGLVLTQRPDIARRVLHLSFPGLLQTRDQNKLAATAHALAEMVAFGDAYARTTIANARALGVALQEHGIRVLAADRGMTDTHQIFADVAALGARAVEERCQSANILLHAAHLSGDTERGRRTGLRITVQEVTRRGMHPGDMPTIARLIAAAAHDERFDGISALRDDVRAVAASFPGIAYSFDV